MIKGKRIVLHTFFTGLFYSSHTSIARSFQIDNSVVDAYDGMRFFYLTYEFINLYTKLTKKYD